MFAVPKLNVGFCVVLSVVVLLSKSQFQILIATLPSEDKSVKVVALPSQGASVEKSATGFAKTSTVALY